MRHRARAAAAAASVFLAGLLLAGCAAPAPVESSEPASSPSIAADARPASEDRIAFARFAELDDPPMLWTANIDGSDERPVGDQTGTFPDFSPDRTHLIFDYLEDGEYRIGRIAIDGSGFEQLTDDALSEAPDYSPDGSTIVFDRSPVAQESDPRFFTTLWVMAADGSGARPLLDPAIAGYDYEAEYSPDGTEIVFVRYDPVADASAVFVASADGSAVRQASPYVAYVEHPRWSPDGSLLVYNVEYRGDLSDARNGIWTVPAAGGEPSALLPTTGSLHGFKPDYSPSGERILFGCFDRTTGVEDICVMNADGTDVTRVMRTAEYENHPVWD